MVERFLACGAVRPRLATRSPMQYRRLLFSVLFLLAAACKHDSSATRVMVVVDAEQELRAEIKDVDLQIKTRSGDESSWSERYSGNLTPGSGAIRWPLRYPLEPRQDEVDQGYLVLVT